MLARCAWLSPRRRASVIQLPEENPALRRCRDPPGTVAAAADDQKMDRWSYLADLQATQRIYFCIKAIEVRSARTLRPLKTAI
jgi:hypothetical protein